MSVDASVLFTYAEAPEPVVQGSAKLSPDRLLISLAVRFWFVVATFGQFFFVAYVITFYAGALLAGEPERWNQVLPSGYVAGDFMGNLAVGLHVLPAIVVTAGGPLQFIPALRRRFPAFHRITGRTYMLAVWVVAFSGVYMVWAKGAVGDISQHIGITGAAILILIFSVNALRHAIARNIASHRRWVLRLFMVASAVWFFRVGLMAWILAHGKPVGFSSETFTGPFLTFLAFAQYLVPLAFAELYLRAERSTLGWPRYAMATAIGLATLVVGVGIFGAVMGLWLPRM